MGTQEGREDRTKEGVNGVIEEGEGKDLLRYPK